MVAYPHMAQRAHEANDFYAGLLDLRKAADSPSLLPSPVVGEAIVGGVFELLHDYILRGHTRRLPELADHITYIALAPFMGAEAAWRAIAEGETSAGSSNGDASEARLLYVPGSLEHIIRCWCHPVPVRPKSAPGGNRTRGLRLERPLLFGSPKRTVDH